MNGGWLSLAPGVAPFAGAVDLDGLWKHADPVAREQAFRAELQRAEGDAAPLSRTQIALLHAARNKVAAAELARMCPRELRRGR